MRSTMINPKDITCSICSNLVPVKSILVTTCGHYGCMKCFDIIGMNQYEMIDCWQCDKRQVGYKPLEVYHKDKQNSAKEMEKLSTTLEAQSFNQYQQDLNNNNNNNNNLHEVPIKTEVSEKFPNTDVCYLCGKIGEGDGSTSRKGLFSLANCKVHKHCYGCFTGIYKIGTKITSCPFC